MSAVRSAMVRNLFFAAGFLSVLAIALATEAGVATEPLPQFADGKPAVLVGIIPGVVKRQRLQTDFLCSSLEAGPVDVGVEIFDQSGARLNDVGTGVGAVLDVQPGQTVTIGTTSTRTFLESVVIPLTGVAQGAARIVASAPKVRCNAVIVDDAVSPPTSMATLSEGVRLSPGPLLPNAPLPTFANGSPATHAAIIPGVTKRVRVQTDIFCTSLDANPIHLGVQVFATDGALQNQVGEGNGAVLDVPPGATITFGTTGTAAFLESAVIVLGNISQGVARIVSTSGQVACSAVLVDAALTPPQSMSGLFTGTAGGGSADVNSDGGVSAADVLAVIGAIFR